MRPLLELLAAALSLQTQSNAAPTDESRAVVQVTTQSWALVTTQRRGSIADDDIRRHDANPAYWDGLTIHERKFSENGFDWHLLRFTNTGRPSGPVWVIPHDDENAAFEAVIVALKQYGGVALVVNSGAGSSRNQAGRGNCGKRANVVDSCDPNRNFAAAAPLYTAAILDHVADGQPVIALHTNSHGFSGDGQGGRGNITILDAAAFRQGVVKPRADGHFAVDPVPIMNDPDTFALTAYLARNGKPTKSDIACRKAMTASGIHFWHERVGTSDGSLSNYLVLNRPNIRYINMESRTEDDLALSASRHAMMIYKYLKHCVSGHKPAR